MSSYIIKYNTMNRIAVYTAMKRKIRFYDENDKLTKEFKNLIKELWALNVEALVERYGEEEKEGNKEYIRGYRFEYEKLPMEFEKDMKLLMKFFKSFANYTYQCAKGKVPEMKLYKEIEGYEKELGCRIAQSLPEWDAGAWE